MDETTAVDGPGTCSACGGQAWLSKDGWWHWTRNCGAVGAAFVPDPIVPEPWEASWQG